MCDQPFGEVRRTSTSAPCPSCVLLVEALSLLEEYAHDLRAVGWPSPKHLRVERFLAKVKQPCMWAGK